MATKLEDAGYFGIWEVLPQCAMRDRVVLTA